MTETQAMPVGRPTHASSGPRREAILELKARGLSGVAIARELGVTPAAVSYHLKRAREQGVIGHGTGEQPAPQPADERAASDDPAL